MARVKVGDLLRLDRVPVEITSGESYRPIGVRSFGRGLIEYPETSADGLSKLAYFEVPADALVVSNIKAWEGAVTHYAGDRKLVTSSRFLCYTARTSDVLTAFVAEYFKSAEGTAQLAAASPGSADRNRTLGRRRFEEILIPLPDLATQRAIAVRLDAIASTDWRLASLVGQRGGLAALAPRVVDDLLGSLDLPVVPVGDLYCSISDVVHPGDLLDSAQRFVGLQHITPHLGTRVGQEAAQDLSGRKLRFARGDVLYGYLRPYLNKVWVADGPGLCSVEQYVLRPRSGVDARLLGHVLRQQATLEAVNTATHNLQLPRIRSGLLAQISVPDIRLALPGLADQLDAINDQINRVSTLASRSRRLIKSLLPAARNEEFRKLLAD